MEYREEKLQQLREELAEDRAELQRRREANVLDSKPAENEWTSFRSPAEMTQGQFFAWVDAGRPALGGAVTAKAAHAPYFTQAIAAERKRAREQALADVEIIAAEVARTQLEERRLLQEEIGQLRAEHQVELQMLCNEILELKAGRPAKTRIRVQAGRAVAAPRFSSH